MPRRKSPEVAPEYFTTFELAKMLQVSPPTVVNWVNSGLLTAHRTPGGHRRISKADLLTFLKENEIPSPFGPSPEQLPLYPPAAAVPPAPPALPAAKRILIVDDLPEFCNVVRDYLVEVGGYDVEVALSGFAAGFTVAQFNPELILLDINLDPHNQGAMDGFELLRTLKDNPRTSAIPVIACTGTADARIEALVRRGKLYAHLEKPFPLSHLADVVGAVLEPSADVRAAGAGNARSSAYGQPASLTVSASRV